MSTLLNIDKQVFSPPELGCVLYLPGLPGGGSKIYDRSPYGNHGTIVGATWRFQNGLWVLSFDGADDHIIIPHAASLSFTTEAFTLEIWAYPDAVASANIIGKGSGLDATQNYNLRFATENRIIFRAQGVTGIDWASAYVTGAWQHIVMTRSGTTAILYVNASVISSETFDADMTANGDDVWIGESENGSNDYNGKFALPRIYKNRALSHLEIQNHFNREKHLFGVW